MTPTTKRHMQLIADLVAFYIDHPDKLKITAAETGVKANGDVESTYWRMQPHAEDYGKLVGSGGGGKNVNALTFLVAELGHAVGTQYMFRLVPPVEPSPERRGDSAMPITEDYDCGPVCGVIQRLVHEIAECDFTVKAEGILPGRQDLTYGVTVAFQDQGEHDYFFDEVVGEVNTLLRAMNRKQGALVEVAVAVAKKAAGAA